jgi:hypothetical protein
MEMGQQPVVCKMFQAYLDLDLCVLPSLQKGQATWKLMSSALRALFPANIDWREYHRDLLLDPYVNDWSLYKGDVPRHAPVPTPSDSPPINTETKSNSQTSRTPHTKSTTVPENIPKLESRTIHKVAEEIVGDETGKLVIESDISRADLNPLV